jgi:hypothetical protein
LIDPVVGFILPVEFSVASNILVVEDDQNLLAVRGAINWKSRGKKQKYCRQNNIKKPTS